MNPPVTHQARTLVERFRTALAAGEHAGLSKWEQLADHLRAEVTRGTYAPDDTLPRQIDIAVELGWSDNTVRRALAELQREGYVTSIRNRGTVVNAIPHLGGRDRAVAVRKTGRIYGEGEYAKILSSELVAAPDEIASVLGIEAGAPAVKRVRVTYGPDDNPRSWSTSWYDGAHAEAAPDLLRPERITAGSWRYLELQTGLQARKGREHIDVRLATEQDAERLNLELPAAVRVENSVLRTPEGIVVEYGVSVSGAGRPSNFYDFELSAPE